MSRFVFNMIGKIVEANKKGYNLVFAGNRYVKNNDSRDQTLTHWRCYDRNRCNGTVSTVLFDTQHPVQEIEVKRIGLPHTHEPDELAREAEAIVRGIKRKAARHPNEPALKIVQEELSAIDTDDRRSQQVLMRVPERRLIFRTVNRQQNRLRPNIPLTREGLNIVAPYDTTLNGERFLQYDSGTEDVERTVIFFTEVGLRHLCRSRIVFADGTFKTCPKPFTQMYTLHGEVRDNVFPFIYALSMRKTQSTYSKILQNVKTHATDLHLNFAPQYIMIDYERAALNAFQTELPEAEIKGCYFHWGQAIWRKAVQTHKLKVIFLSILRLFFYFS